MMSVARAQHFTWSPVIGAAYASDPGARSHTVRVILVTSRSRRVGGLQGCPTVPIARFTNVERAHHAALEAVLASSAIDAGSQRSSCACQPSVRAR